jgi:hypothetical protein
LPQAESTHLLDLVVVIGKENLLQGLLKASHVLLHTDERGGGRGKWSQDQNKAITGVDKKKSISRGLHESRARPDHVHSATSHHT